MSSAMLIRDPRPADAPDLGRLHAAAWQAAYQELMPAALLAEETVERRTAFWHRILGAERGERQRIVVAEVDGRAAGFAWTGPCRDAEDPTASVDGVGELYALNVDPRFWGRGVGAALLEAAHGSLVAAGFPRAVLWVVAGNDRARRFYDRAAWTFDGTTRIDEDGVSEVRYTRQLDAPTA